jgi:hypothetical protein
LINKGAFKKSGKVLFRNIISHLFDNNNLGNNNARTLVKKNKEILTACRGNNHVFS